jgi:iron complex outermembrane receptor protein
MGATAIATVMGLMAFAPERPAVAHVSMTAREVSEGVKAYKIPQGSAAEALNRLADESGVRMIYRAQLTKNLQTRGLSGNYTLTGALDALLSGTGLQYRLSENGRKVSIVLAQNNNGSRTDAVPAGAEALPTIDIGAAQPVQAGPGGEGQGASPGIAGAGNGTGAGSYGGAGLAQDPYNHSYVLPDASVGTRTDTPIMETPLSVVVVSQQVLQDQQVTSLDQAVKNVSGVTITGQANSVGIQSEAITIRGFTTSDVYRDGFRVDGGAASTFQFANVASVEVLKGSGAILYGFSEPGGIVSYTTKQPLDAPYYAVQQQVGSFGNYRTTIDATGPLNADKSLLYRMDMSYQNNGSPFGAPVDLVYDQNIFLAPVLKWNIDGANWVKLEADYLYDKGSYFYPYDLMSNGAWVALPRSLNYNESSPALTKSLYTALSWSHQFDNDWAIKQQIAYYRSDLDNITRGEFGSIDFSGPTPTIDRGIAVSTSSQATYSTNVDLTGHVDTFGAQHTLLLGGDFYKQNRYDLETAQGAFGASQISLLYPVHPGTSFVPGGPLFPIQESSQPQDTAGLYAQDQIKLPYDLFFMAGARYQYIRQNGGLYSGSTFSAPGGTTVNTADTETALTPRFGLTWRPEQWVSFYTHYAEGFSANTGTVYPDTRVPPTSSSDAEAGVKLEFFDGKLRVTTAYYDLTKTNYAVTDPNPAHACNGGLPGLSCSLVDGAVRSKGVEVDVQGTLLPGWNVSLAYSNSDARITKTNPGPDQTGTLGQRIQGVPRNLGSFTTSYEFQDDSPLKGLKIGGGVDYHGSQPYDGSTQPVGTPQWPLLSAYATVNLFTAYSFNIAGTKMTAQVNVTNLLDHTYYTDAFPFVAPNTPGLSEAYRPYGPPLTILGSLKAEWPGVPSSLSSSSSIFSPAPSSARAYSWTGLYVGAQIGYGFGDNTGNVAFTTPGGMSGAPPLVGDASGVIGGAHVGYNLQIDPWVIGVEGTVDGANLSKQPLIAFAGPSALSNPANFFGAPYGGVVGGSVASDIQGSIRARAGYAFGRLLPFVTAGAAFGHFSTTANIGGTDFPPGGSYFAGSIGSTSRVRLGWTFGGGVEYAVNDHWSVRGEYRYSDFGNFTDAPASLFPGLAFSTTRELAQHQVQVGFSYKFGEDSSERSSTPLIVKGQALNADLRSPPPASQPASVQASPTNPLAKLVAPSTTDWTKYSWTGLYLGVQAGYAMPGATTI